MTIYSFDLLLFFFWNQSVVPCPVLTAAFWPAYRDRSGGLVCPSLEEFIVIHTVKGFRIVNKAQIDVFLECSCFFDDPADIGNLISNSSAFSKTSLNIWVLYHLSHQGSPHRGLAVINLPTLIQTIGNISHALSTLLSLLL